MPNFKEKPLVTIVGAGFVGMSTCTIFSKKFDVNILEIDKKKIRLINNKQSPIDEPEIDAYLKKSKNNILATSSARIAFKNSKLIILSLPTDLDPNTKNFNTDALTKTIKLALHHNDDASIIIKSTVNIGYTKNLSRILLTDRIIFAPEFLREGSAVFDNLNPSRVIVGGKDARCRNYIEILQSIVTKKPFKKIIMSSCEAEAVKLFSNAYLAMRVSFFNELDTFSIKNSLSSKNIIDGVCLDDRIGNKYNNPSFGFGGYCLPKDVQQLSTDLKNIKTPLIKSIYKSNESRADFVLQEIKKINPKIVGIYKLGMKKDSNNIKESILVKILERLKTNKIKAIIYEPSILKNSFKGFKIINDIDVFQERSEIVLSNRQDSELNIENSRLFCRDIYKTN